ncbi:MAG: imidazole glycerol phosphate synthase subunit HisF [Lachnospiraceae bacterium]|jgi:cyclase|nr:imidazole glycerol phosphate synthase subunit HisF [Lachnospiraceae bacterium]
MLAKRIIPCLDVRSGRVVKGRQFEGIRDVEDPVAMAAFYNEAGADELVFYDITASAEGRKIFTDMVREVAKQIFIPLTVGGGIESLQDFDRVLASGADKVSVNSGALKNPALIEEAAQKYGDQCVVLSVDAKRVNGEFHVFTKGGREDTGRLLKAWVKEGVERGAGEIVLNSMDMDGVKQGFDLKMLAELTEYAVPIIASGGAGKKEDFLQLFQSLPSVSAGLAASIFHYQEVKIAELKAYLAQNQIVVRQTN